MCAGVSDTLEYSGTFATYSSASYATAVSFGCVEGKSVTVPLIFDS